MLTGSLTGIVLDNRYRAHDPGCGHPEQAARYDAVERALLPLISSGVCVGYAPRSATVGEVCLCHSEDYVKKVRREIESGAMGLSTGDTDVCAETYGVAMLAVGGGLSAVDAVVSGSARNVFCGVRPPGHHATREKGMGFCVFNNAAIAARYAQVAHGVKRVLIVDWDVHHGNGTQAIFNEDSTVFYFSTHQWPCYPGTGIRSDVGMGAGKGFSMNWPTASGSGGRELLAAFKEGLIPAMRKFRPEFVVISAGFDARVGDPIGGMCVTDEEFGCLTSLVVGIAGEYAGGRLVSFLEGGYDPAALGSAVLAHVKAMVRRD